MTITHDQVGLQIPGYSLLLALTTMPTAAIRLVRHWHLKTVQARTTAKLSTHLKYDVGDTDLKPTPVPTHKRSEPPTYQDALQQAWLR